MTTVLVVDDEFLVASVVTFALEDMGFRVLHASDGKKALEILHCETPALVISDYMMPVMNGVELARALKQNTKWSEVPIILMSGGHVDQAKRSSDLFDVILQKPFDIDTLTDTVAKFVNS